MFFYGWEIKTSLVRETALGQSRIILQEYDKLARSSGRKARRHWCIRPLSGPSQKQTTPACMLKPQAFICSWYRVCAHVCVYHCVCVLVCTFMVCLYVHAYVCVYIQYISVSMCIHCACVCACLHMGFVQAQKVVNSSVCGCVLIQTDAVW